MGTGTGTMSYAPAWRTAAAGTLPWNAAEAELVGRFLAGDVEDTFAPLRPEVGRLKKQG